MKLAKTSIALLIIQLAIVSSIAAKYLYQRMTCPRVWTRVEMYDPELLMRGRYLALRLTVDACGHMPPPEPTVIAPVAGAPGKTEEVTLYRPPFKAKLAVSNNKLVAAWIPDDDMPGVMVDQSHMVNGACDLLLLQEPVNFYIPEHATTPPQFGAGHELWIEVTLPPKGPPRPLQLANKENGVWKPLKF